MAEKILAKFINFVLAWTNLRVKSSHDDNIFPKRKCKAQRNKTKPNSLHVLHKGCSTHRPHHGVPMRSPVHQRRHFPSRMRSPSLFLLELFSPPKFTVFPPAISSSSNYIPDDRRTATPDINLTPLYLSTPYALCMHCFTKPS